MSFAKSNQKPDCNTMKNIESAITETLSTNATIYGADGLQQATGVTVRLVNEPTYSEYASRYLIGRTEHVASDIIREGNELLSLAAGWTVTL